MKFRVITDWGTGRVEELETSFDEDVSLAENSETNPELEKQLLAMKIAKLGEEMKETPLKPIEEFDQIKDE